jgi:two-component system capsular synthesis sensor histidine kinase RcsC
LQVPAAVASGAFDAILMDLNMPHVGGDVACAALRAAGSRIPILAVSGTTEGEALVRRFGFTAILGKPFSVEQLREALEKHCSRRGSSCETEMLK